MSEMLRRGRRVVVATTVASCVMFAGYAGTAFASDFDGDGFSPPADCNDLDSAIHPGAVDKPDQNFVDSNCDGIDGDINNAIFVSLGGNDAAPGTLTNPVKTIGKAISLAAAASPKKDVYIAGGEFDESLNMVSGVSLYGDYEPITGKRSLSQNTVIKGFPPITAAGVTGVELQDLTLQGLANGVTGDAYAIRAVNSGPGAANPTRLAIDGVTAQAGTAAAGGSLGNGGAGATGGGFAGGAGGAGGCGTGVLGSSGGFGSGTPGTPGASGANNALATLDLADWPRTIAVNGIGGNPGNGGSGGRGGDGSGFGPLVPLCGGNGGHGGSGGGGGGGGGGGQNGAGSFGAYLLNSSLVAFGGSKLIAAAGGNGGNGGNGGTGGAGTPGLPGLPGACFGALICASDGGSGGSGGSGGNGGGGGAGVGGPSVGVYQAGPASGFAALTGTVLTPGTAGTGGRQGNGGAFAPNGQSVGRLASGTAPATSTADFDGDGVADPSDACPATPAGTANGCPPNTALTDTDGDGVPDTADACPTVPAGANDANGDGCPDPAPAPGGGGGTGGGGGGGGGVVTPPAPEQIVVTLSFFAKASAKHTKLTSLKVRNIPLGATVHVTCKGKGCPKGLKGKGYTKKNAFGALNLKKFIKKPLRVGVTITVVVSKPNAIDAVKILTIRKSKTPRISTRCLPPGAKKAVACA